MKLIDFGKIGEHFEKTLRFPFRRKRSPRTNIVLTVIHAIVAGFFIGATLFEYLHGRGFLSWIWPLVMAFVSGLTTLKGTFVALHNCPRSAKTPENEPALHNVRA
jgi:fatty acid desaturase